jgi:staphylococcal nuclease domain-containing protein 1
MTHIVFAVDSADRLTLLCPPSGSSSEPELKLVALSFIQCPRMGKRMASGEPTPDEPCAYDAMEFVRSQCIGKQVTFTDDFMIEPLQRMSGRLTLPSGEDCAVALLRQGLATVADRAPPKMDKSLHEKYVAAMTAAKEAKKGIFAANAKNQVRKLVAVADAESAAASLKGKDEKARVEKVFGGATLFVTLLSTNQQVQVNLTGIQCPPARRIGEAPSTTPETAIGDRAKFHTERFLLHRNVTIRVEGTQYQNLLASIVSPKGTFQEELLAKGLAKVAGATVSLTDARDALRAAEKAAQDARAGVWKDFQERALVVQNAPLSGIPAEAPAAVTKDGAAVSGPKDFEGVVIQIVNSDTIVVRNVQTNENSKVSLSGIKTSKNVTKDQDGKETRVTYADYAFEAKELLRVKAIGRRVLVHVDSARVIEPTKEVRANATVVDAINNTNLAALLVEEGYASIFRPEQSSCADALVDAERIAKAKQAGIHGTKDAPVTKLVELSKLGDAKGKYYLSFLHRGMQGNRPPVWKGVVDVVLGASSLRVYIAREHFQIPLKLAGVMAPNGAGINGEPADPFAQEAKDFAVSQLQQVDVEVSVDTSDRAGNFIGCVTYGPQNKNFAVALVEAGFATVANAERLPYYSNLLAAEKLAKDAKRNIWSSASSVPAKFAKMQAAMLAADPSSLQAAVGAAWEPVTLANVVDGSSVFLQRRTPAAEAQLAAVSAALQLAASSAEPYVPSKGELVACYYKEDKSWHRAKVRSASKEEGYAVVLFQDFGSEEEVKLKDIRRVPKEPQFAVLRDTPSLGYTAHLAFLRPMGPDQEFCDRACEEIWAAAEKAGNISARTVCTDASKTYVVLAKQGAEHMDDIAAHLLQSGLALVAKQFKAVDPKGYAAMEKAQEAARRGHKNMWRYGDVDQDEDEDM